MVNGPAGILACSPPDFMPRFRGGKDTQVTWPNGSLARCFSSERPERLRGPQCHWAWADELGAWRYGATWDQLQFGLRMVYGGDVNPRCVVTTTPRPMLPIRELVRRFREHDPAVVITGGSTYDNRDNLAPSFFEDVVKKYEGTRLGRQELDAQLLDDVPGALWSYAVIDATRLLPDARLPAFTRIVIAVDPPATSGEDADECGMVVAALGEDKRGYVLHDLSTQGDSPLQWAKRAVEHYHSLNADRIVAETNQGGEMVETVLRQVDPSVSYRGVHASRGKVTRAEPISALYEQSRVSHVGSFPKLEDQMASFTTDFDPARAGFSPDRLDALVYALTDLMLGYQTTDIGMIGIRK
jgi:phage terminase large subunit-like protein